MSKPTNRKRSLSAERLQRTTVHVDVAQCIRQLCIVIGLLVFAVNGPEAAVALFSPKPVVEEASPNGKSRPHASEEGETHACFYSRASLGVFPPSPPGAGRQVDSATGWRRPEPCTSSEIRSRSCVCDSTALPMCQDGGLLLQRAATAPVGFAVLRVPTTIPRGLGVLPSEYSLAHAGVRRFDVSR